MPVAGKSEAHWRGCLRVSASFSPPYASCRQVRSPLADCFPRAFSNSEQLMQVCTWTLRPCSSFSALLCRLPASQKPIGWLFSARFFKRSVVLNFLSPCDASKPIFCFDLSRRNAAVHFRVSSEHASLLKSESIQ